MWYEWYEVLFCLFLIRVKNQVENTCLEAQISGNERKMIACVLSYSLTVYVIITPLFWIKSYCFITWFCK